MLFIVKTKRQKFYNKRFMSQGVTPCFTRYYKYTQKRQNDFSIHYLLTQPLQATNTTPSQAQPNTKQETSNEQVTETTIDQQQEVNKYQKVKTKKVKAQRPKQEQNEEGKKVSKKTYKFKNDNQGKQENQQNNRKNRQNKGKQSNEVKGNYHKVHRGRDQRTKSHKKIYKQHLDIEIIQASRQNNENKYWMGRLQFGEGPKNRGKIICEQIQGLMLVQGEAVNRGIHDDIVFFTTGKQERQAIWCEVVHVVQRQRPIVGRVEKLQNKQLILKPINARIADLNIQSQSLPEDLQEYANTHYFLAWYSGWQAHQQYPKCKLVKPFGKFGQIQTETSALLKTQGVEDKDYDPQTSRADLKKFMDLVDERGQYQIPHQQLLSRQDLRQRRIFTIDPLNARDFDDALSIQQTKEGWKVGVHIADASYFVQQGSPVDLQARKRTTSVYLIHRVIPMLPRVLCQNLCSLNPGSPRLTFTIWLNLAKDGSLIDEPQIARSVICSKARFTYQQAQRIIQGQAKCQKDIQNGFGCVKAQDFDEIARDIVNLHKVASALRQIRIARGALFFQVPKKVFSLGQDGLPKSFSIYERKEAHYLVQQLMILANEQVGTLLVKYIGGTALLRRHRFPGVKKIAKFQQVMDKLGQTIKITKQTRVQEQVNALMVRQNVKQSHRDIIKYEMIGLLEAADYFLVGRSKQQSWVHYALNAPIYTHFTSPIRRYPDIIVHRLLAHVLKITKQQKIQQIQKESVSSIASLPKALIQLCNQKKLQAKRVSVGCQKIFLCLYLRGQPVIGKGIIQEVQDWGIRIVMPKFDFKGVLRFKQIAKLVKQQVKVDQRERKIAKLNYTADPPFKITLKELQEVQVQLSCREGFPLDYRLTLAMPHPQQPNQRVLIQ